MRPLLMPRRMAARIPVAVGPDGALGFDEELEAAALGPGAPPIEHFQPSSGFIGDPLSFFHEGHFLHFVSIMFAFATPAPADPSGATRAPCTCRR